MEGTRELPPAARWYIGTLTVAAGGVVWWASHHEVVIAPLDVFLVLAVVAIAVDSQPLTFSYRGQLFSFTLGTPFMLAVLTLFGVLPAVVVQAIGSIAGDLLGRKAWPKILFNVSQFVVSVGAAGAVLHALAGPIAAPVASHESGQLPPLFAALAVFFIVNSLCNGGIIQLVSGWPARRILTRFVSRESLVEASALCLVPVVALSVRHNPVLALLLTVPVLAIARATRLAMENVTLLESHAAALEEKHAANRLAQQREAEREAAERANTAKSEFLSQMSHELRTPLNAVLGFAQLLDMDPLTPEQHDGMKEILRAGEHLLSLINEVLDMASIEAGRLRISLEPVDALDTVRECLSLVAPLADDHGVRLELDETDGEVLLVAADRQRLRQVALNLVSNAIKYNRPGGTVSTAVRCTPGGVAIDVIDTGHGIAPDKLGHLFAPFERLGAEASDIEGTGLGLALSKRIVEAMGGTISVASELGSGTTFSVELARAEAGLLGRS